MKIIARVIAAILGLMLLLNVTGGRANAASGQHKEIRKDYSALVHKAFRVLPDCEYEDSRNCRWDAGTAGNGIGHSFVNFNGHYFYMKKADQRRWGNGSYHQLVRGIAVRMPLCAKDTFTNCAYRNGKPYIASFHAGRFVFYVEWKPQGKVVMVERFASERAVV